MPTVSKQKGKGSQTKLSAKARRRRRRRKAMKNLFGTALGSLGGTLGSEFGPSGTVVGGGFGRKIGRGIGGLISKITGMGDYKITSNTVALGGQAIQPTFGGGTTRIKHREYIREISTATDGKSFSIQKFPINPGLRAVFPWLSQIAANYTQFKIHGLVFEFVSNSGTAVGSTNTALGSVIMATDYDVLSPEFQTKREMESTMYCSTSVPSSNLLHAVECAPGKTVLDDLYIRSEAYNADQADIRFHDLGNFYIATVGMQASSVIGELWVTYDVSFLKARLETPLYGTYSYGHFYTYNGDPNFSGPTTGQTFLTDVGTDPETSSIFAITSSGSLFTQEPGVYICLLNLSCTSGTPSLAGPNGFTSGEVELVGTVFDNFGGSSISANQSLRSMYAFVYKVYHHGSSVHDNRFFLGNVTYSGTLDYLDAYVFNISGLVGTVPEAALEAKRFRNMFRQMVLAKRPPPVDTKTAEARPALPTSGPRPRSGTPRPAKSDDSESLGYVDLAHIVDP